MLILILMLLRQLWHGGTWQGVGLLDRLRHWKWSLPRGLLLLRLLLD